MNTTLMLLAALVCTALHAGNVAAHANSITGDKLPASPDPWAKKWTVMTANVSVAAIGNSVYVWSYYSGRLVRFERDVKTADISYKESWLSPYRKKWVSMQLIAAQAGSGQDILYAICSKPDNTAYWYNIAKNGAVTLQGKLKLQCKAQAVLTPDGKTLYHVGEKISWYKIGDDGALKLINSISVDKHGAKSIDNPTFSSDGRYLFYGLRAHPNQESQIVVCRRSEDGSISPSAPFVLSGYAPKGKSNSPALALSPDGKHLYANVWAWDNGRQYLLSHDNGTLKIIDSSTPPGQMRNLSHITFNPDGKSGYYIANSPGGACTGWFSRDPDSGKLTPLGKYKAGSGRYNSMFLDSKNGNLFSVCFHYNPKGTAISAFKTPTFKSK